MKAFHFLGGDPAPAERERSDDGGLVVLRAHLREGLDTLTDHEMDYVLEAVYAERVTCKRKLSGRQWAGLLHGLHRDFRFAALCLDPNHGGRYILRDLASTRVPIEGVETEVKPLCTVSDPVPFGEPIVHLFQRKDPGIDMLWSGLAGDDALNDALYTEVKHMLARGGVLLPKEYKEWTREEKHLWSEKQTWAAKNLHSRNLEPKGSLVEQFANFQIKTHADGTEMFTKNNARVFQFTGKKDLVSAFCYAYCAFRIWLVRHAATPQLPDEDIAGCAAF